MPEFPNEINDKKHAKERFLKIVVIGPGFVGKTGITTCFCTGVPRYGYEMTIGVNFGVKRVEFNGNSYILQIWDVAGQERFKIFREQYYEGAHGAILVYDITNRLTFLELENWVHEFQQHAGPKPVIIAGNKRDLAVKGRREVDEEEGRKFARTINAGFFETSAVENFNVSKIFHQLINSFEQNKSTNLIKLRYYDNIESGFSYLGKALLNNEYDKIQEAIIKLKNSIFSKNPYSLVLGDISNLINDLSNNRIDQRSREKLAFKFITWRNYYSQSLEEGRAVRPL
ncbi:MAG: Rab family GTPase [Candidatus Helarchaeales archaeon]